MKKIKLKNTTGSNFNRLGQTLIVGEYFDIPPNKVKLWKEDPDVAADIASGVLAVNDGASDLNAAEGVAYFNAPEDIVTKAIAPTADDDIDAGFEIGDRWLDKTGLELYVCFNNSVGAADWQPMVRNTRNIDLMINMFQNHGKSWTRAGAQFRFAGTTLYGAPTSIKVVAGHESSPTDIRIYDATNNKVICSITSIPTTTGIMDLGTISNLPAEEAIWELQFQEGSSGKVDIHSLHIIF